MPEQIERERSAVDDGGACASRPWTFRLRTGSQPEIVQGSLSPETQRSAGFQGPQPWTFGIPVSKGELVGSPSGGRIAVAGELHSAQLEVRERWPDGSVRWLLVDTVLSRLLPEQAELELQLDAAVDDERDGIRIQSCAEGFTVATGAATFCIDAVPGQAFAGLMVNGCQLADASVVEWIDRRGKCHLPVLKGASVETQGPLRTTLRLEGMVGPRVNVTLRLSFFARTGLVRIETTLHNPRRARHRGGLWDLGDAGSVLFTELAVVFDVSGLSPRRVAIQPEPQLDWFESSEGAIGIYQDSSGGENWQSLNHVNREGRVPCRFRGYRLRAGEHETRGLRASPLAVVEGEAGSLALSLPEFWQQFPKAIRADGRTVRVGLFPAEFDDLHELQGGERKTHTCWLCFSQKRASLITPQEPPPAIAARHLAAADSVLPELPLAPSAGLARLDSYLAEARERVEANRERVDEYGWRNFGDIHADHEEQYYRGPQPLVSHYNNQFDMLYGFQLTWLRTGDAGWWRLADALARHVMDIDIYHTTQDRAAYNGGLFWFTDHYLHAHTSTHRTYSIKNAPRNRKGYGGGPSSSHCFTSGLTLYYRLTGNIAAREAVVELAEFIVGADDGRRTILGLFDAQPTGRASCSGSGDFHGPGRGAGNSINALLDAWLLTQGRHYLDYAEHLIRRTIHPRDDIDALELLDVERRWSYTVFLSSLTKYLQVKQDAGELDDRHTYAQAALLHYAEWMLEHEVPYFDQFEKLEYPTEAWAAQEFRKANVLRLAARQAEEPLSTLLREKGKALAERAWNDLQGFRTRYAARAMAIVMQEGLLDLALRTPNSRPVCRAGALRDFGEPVNFAGQKQRIAAQLRQPRGAARLAMRAFNPAVWYCWLTGPRS